ncbi:hypothetical protein CNYM01_13521 [Colletotrichum nymphaeae SA-01]|uniref:Uncharacterized protein n=1 Tax=Colletotrichum nymphaeae SA-01 TaxID=1460502 RepID=A0A135S5H5_9PEZI|nr:hypothetical protein CNYM01_13521 [Colletotrichum nymphaeae SA-01]
MRPALASPSPAPTLTHQAHQGTKQAKLATTQTLRAARPLCLPPMAPTQPMPLSSQAVAMLRLCPSICGCAYLAIHSHVHAQDTLSTRTLLRTPLRLYATTVQLRIYCGPDCAAQVPVSLPPSHGPSIHGPSGPVTGPMSHLMDHPQSHNAAPNSEASCPRPTSSGGRHRRGPWAVVDHGPWVVCYGIVAAVGAGPD